jgi:hypothetical protein
MDFLLLLCRACCQAGFLLFCSECTVFYYTEILRILQTAFRDSIMDDDDNVTGQDYGTLWDRNW